MEASVSFRKAEYQNPSSLNADMKSDLIRIDLVSFSVTWEKQFGGFRLFPSEQS